VPRGWRDELCGSNPVPPGECWVKSADERDRGGALATPAVLGGDALSQPRRLRRATSLSRPCIQAVNDRRTRHPGNPRPGAGRPDRRARTRPPGPSPTGPRRHHGRPARSDVDNRPPAKAASFARPVGGRPRRTRPRHAPIRPLVARPDRQDKQGCRRFPTRAAEDTSSPPTTDHWFVPGIQSCTSPAGRRTPSGSVRLLDVATAYLVLRPWPTGGGVQAPVASGQRRSAATPSGTG
jgi:hypothetical protein